MNDNNKELEVLGKRDLTNSYQKVKLDIPKYWERNFINNTLNGINNHKHKMLLLFLWRTGVRVSEAINLTKDKIDFDNYLITVRWLKSRKYHERTLPIHPEVRNLLQLFTATMKYDEIVFPMSRQRVWQLVKKYFNGNPHQFRHSFAVNWLRCKCDIYILHKVLGHSNIQTTMKYLMIVPIDQGEELMKVIF